MITNELLFNLLIITGILGTIIFVLFMYLVAQRVAKQKQLDKIQHYSRLYEKNWYDYLVFNEPLPVKKRNDDFQDIELLAIDRIFFKYSATLNNAMITNQISLYATEYMQPYYTKKIQSKSWAERVNVLKKISLFKLNFLLPNVEERLLSKKINEPSEIVLSLSLIAANDFNRFIEIINTLGIELNTYEYKLILSKLTKAQMVEIHSLFERQPDAFKLAYLDILATESSLNHTMLSFLESLLMDSLDEVRIKVLKAIRSFGTVTSLHLYKDFLDSSIWEERYMLASILKLTDASESYILLRDLMKDSNWKVRKEAALSLKQKKLGENILEQMAKQVEDKYAAEISKEVLALG